MMAHEFIAASQSPGGPLMISGMSWYDLLRGDVTLHCHRCGRMIPEEEAGGPCQGRELPPEGVDG